MYLVFYLQVCFVLVSSNPLYDFSCCPTTYPSYVNDQPFIVQRSNYNPYPRDLLVHNRWNPTTNSQSVPHQYQYLNSNNFIPNYQLYNQNGLDVLQHVPETETEKVINNYILIPEDYFYNNAIENERHKKTEAVIRKTNNNKNNKRNKSKKRRPEISPKIYNGSTDINNPETKTTKPKGCRQETENSKSGRTKSKKKSNKNNLETTDVEDTLPLKTNKNHGEAIKNTNNHLIGSRGKKIMDRNKSPTNKPISQEPKTTKGFTKEEVVNDYIPDVNIKSKKKDGTGFADVNVCFDINEDCADLDCRHTRNKDVNNINEPQSLKSTPDLPNNLNNYMNSLTLNQQMNPNVFNPNVNFPFNFDYLYQMSNQSPQTSNVQPKETNNRRRNRKRKQPTSNRSTNLNKKNKNLITTVDNCDKIVELTPEIPKFETSTIATETITNAEEPEYKNVCQEEPTLESLSNSKDQESNLEKPIRTYTETLLTEVLSNDEITNNNNVQLDNYNDVIDEYYPDFTLDNTYMSSKEDYDFSNFHDRYYYAYGDKPELNRERRKYEHPNENKLNRHRKIDVSNNNKNIIQEPSQIQEIIFKTDTSKEKIKILTPSALEFPGFKTEMINKEKYFAKEEQRSKNYDVNDFSTNKICLSSKIAEYEENQHNNNVEMVFANSKVVKYGAPEKEEVILKVPEPQVKKEFKNLISNDGKTTVVIAKSLGYS